MSRSGPPIDCPAFATSSAAEPPPTAASSPRRLIVGGSGDAATRSPSGSGRVAGEVVAQRGQHAAGAVRAQRDRHLDHEVDGERDDEDDGRVVVRLDEVEAEDVPVLDVRDPGGEQEERARHEQRDRHPLDGHGGRRRRRPGEQPRDHRPQLRQQDRHGDQAARDVHALRERVEPRRPRRPVEEPGERQVGVDQAVAAEVGLVGEVGQEAGHRHGRDEHEQQRAEHRREPRAPQRGAPEPGPERPRRRVHDRRSRRANQRPPASSVAAGTSPAARASGAIPSAPTVAQPNHGLIASGRLEPHADPPRRDAGRRRLHQHRAARGDQRARPRQQRGRRAADADVAVEQQRGPPRARVRDLGEHGAQDRLGAARPGEPDRDGGEVEARAPHGRRRRAPRGAGRVRSRCRAPAPRPARAARGRRRRPARASGPAAAAGRGRRRAGSAPRRRCRRPRRTPAAGRRAGRPARARG